MTGVILFAMGTWANRRCKSPAERKALIEMFRMLVPFRSVYPFRHWFVGTEPGKTQP